MVGMSSSRAPEPLVLRGALFTLRRKCGKAGCRCASDERAREPGAGLSGRWAHEDDDVARGPGRGGAGRAGPLPRGSR